jgi:hypothetical protein
MWPSGRKRRFRTALGGECEAGSARRGVRGGVVEAGRCVTTLIMAGLDPAIFFPAEKKDAWIKSGQGEGVCGRKRMPGSSPGKMNGGGRRGEATTRTHRDINTCRTSNSHLRRARPGDPFPAAAKNARIESGHDEPWGVKTYGQKRRAHHQRHPLPHTASWRPLQVAPGVEPDAADDQRRADGVRPGEVLAQQHDGEVDRQERRDV